MQERNKARQPRKNDSLEAQLALVRAGRAAIGKQTLTSHLGGGMPLPDNLKAKFELSLGHDLSHVRIHADAETGRFVDLLGGHAIAAGEHIAFGPGQYDPHSEQGQALIAHEVAHAEQQRGASANELKVTDPRGAIEQDAEAAATAMVAGIKAQVMSAPHAIARKAKDDVGDMPEIAGDIGGDHGDAGGAEHGSAKEETPNLGAGRSGAEPDESGMAPEEAKPNTEPDKAKLVAIGTDQDVTKPDTGGAAPEGGDAPIPTDPVAATQQAQQEAQAAQTDASQQSEAFKADMAQHQQQYEADKQQTVLDELQKMSPQEKRKSLADLGYDPKKIKQLKDSELDDLIKGKLEQEDRKAKILGMDPDELAKLSSDQKKQFLQDIGIDRGDLDKAGSGKCDKLFADVIQAAHVPGVHKVKIKIKGGLFGKSWEVTVTCDTERGVDIQAKKEGGFFSKLLGWIKAALPIILTVLAPLTGGATLIVLAVYQSIRAIQTGDWFGLITGVAGALVGLGALQMVAKGTSALATGLQKVAQVADKVKKAADAAHAALLATKAKNPGSLLAALASGAAAFASFASNASGKFATTMKSWSTKLQKWSKIGAGVNTAVDGIKHHDAIAAIGGAFDAASAAVGPATGTGKQLQRAGNLARFIDAGRKALGKDPPDYLAVSQAALGIAGQLHADQRIDDAAQIVAKAGALEKAWAGREKNPGGVVDASVALAGAIQTAKYDFTHDPKKDADGKPLPDAERTALVQKYARINRVVNDATAVYGALTAKPQPDYAAAIAAATKLVSEYSDNKVVDATPKVASAVAALIKARQGGNEKAIWDAGVALGNAINGMRTAISKEREEAQKDVSTKLPPGEPLPTAELPPVPVTGDFSELIPLPTEGITGPIGELVAIDIPAPEAPAPSGRSSTPGANYTVIPGDSLSWIGSRFHVTVGDLRNLNTQIVGDKIYVGQGLYVPGADTLLKPSVTVDEKFDIDPAVAAAASRERAAQSAKSQSMNVRGQIKVWKDASYGAFFARTVLDFEGVVDSLDAIVANPKSTAAEIGDAIGYVNREFMKVDAVYKTYRGQTDALIDFGIEAATLIRDGAGEIIDVLDRTKLISAGYQAVITAIDAYANGSSGGMIALKAATAAVLDAVEPFPEAKGLVKRWINESMGTVGEAVLDVCYELIEKPDMSEEEKREVISEKAKELRSDLVLDTIKALIGPAVAKVLPAETQLETAMREAYEKAVEAAKNVKVHK
jgi:LysM repeat protein